MLFCKMSLIVKGTEFIPYYDLHGLMLFNATCARPNNIFV